MAGNATPDNALWANNFAAGFLDTPDTDALPTGATPEARNTWFYKVDASGASGGVRALTGKRPGSALLNPTALASGEPVDIFEFRRASGAHELLAVCDGALAKWDGATAFTAIGSGWTSGNRARCTVFRGEAYVYDGAYMRRYDGTNLKEVGSTGPASVTNMTAVAPTGGGVTGTYTAVYAWSEPAVEHYSPLSSETASLAPAAQARRHTKPGGSAPAWATHWTIFVRRTDTNELNHYHVADVAIATATYDEEVSDTARRTPAPKPSENDPPAGAWAILQEWRGWGIGVLPSTDEFYVSRRGDLQSWHPRDKFAVARGNGELITAVRKFAKRLLVMKPHSTHELVGDRVPFEIEDFDGSAYGSVSQEAGVVVDGRLYDWDRVRGPYVTDLATWRPLADGRIAETVATVNLTALEHIRAVHDERNNLIVWAVPTTGSARARTLLAYHYLLDAWLAPLTGLEFRSLAAFTTSGGELGVYTGDQWGRVHQLFTGTTDSVPSGTTSGTVTAATTDTVTDSAAAFYTTGAGLAGLLVAVRSASSGTWQWRRIASNTATVLTLDTTNGGPWTTVPTAGDLVIVGGIEWYHWTPILDFSRPEMKKRLHYLFVGASSTTSAVELDVRMRLNSDSAQDTEGFEFPLGSLSGVWGTSLWGVARWGARAQRILRKTSIERHVYAVQFQVANYLPGQPVELNTWGLTSDALPRILAPGART
jgi:hypothetical protein